MDVQSENDTVETAQYSNKRRQRERRSSILKSTRDTLIDLDLNAGRNKEERRKSRRVSFAETHEVVVFRDAAEAAQHAAQEGSSLDTDDLENETDVNSGSAISSLLTCPLISRPEISKTATILDVSSIFRPESRSSSSSGIDVSQPRYDVSQPRYDVSQPRIDTSQSQQQKNTSQFDKTVYFSDENEMDFTTCLSTSSCQSDCNKTSDKSDTKSYLQRLQAGAFGTKDSSIYESVTPKRSFTLDQSREEDNMEFTQGITSVFPSQNMNETLYESSMETTGVIDFTQPGSQLGIHTQNESARSRREDSKMVKTNTMQFLNRLESNTVGGSSHEFLGAGMLVGKEDNGVIPTYDKTTFMQSSMDMTCLAANQTRDESRSLSRTIIGAEDVEMTCVGSGFISANNQSVRESRSLIYQCANDSADMELTGQMVNISQKVVLPEPDKENEFRKIVLNCSANSSPILVSDAELARKQSEMIAADRLDIMRQYKEDQSGLIPTLRETAGEEFACIRDLTGHAIRGLKANRFNRTVLASRDMELTLAHDGTTLPSADQTTHAPSEMDFTRCVTDSNIHNASALAENRTVCAPSEMDFTLCSSEFNAHRTSEPDEILSTIAMNNTNSAAVIADTVRTQTYHERTNKPVLGNSSILSSDQYTDLDDAKTKIFQPGFDDLDLTNVITFKALATVVGEDRSSLTRSSSSERLTSSLDYERTQIFQTGTDHLQLTCVHDDNDDLTTGENVLKGMDYVSLGKTVIFPHGSDMLELTCLESSNMDLTIPDIIESNTELKPNTVGNVLNITNEKSMNQTKIKPESLRKPESKCDAKVDTAAKYAPPPKKIVVTQTALKITSLAPGNRFRKSLIRVSHITDSESIAAEPFAKKPKIDDYSTKINASNSYSNESAKHPSNLNDEVLSLKSKLPNDIKVSTDRTGIQENAPTVTGANVTELNSDSTSDKSEPNMSVTVSEDLNTNLQSYLNESRSLNDTSKWLTDLEIRPETKRLTHMNKTRGDTFSTSSLSDVQPPEYHSVLDVTESTNHRSANFDQSAPSIGISSGFISKLMRGDQSTIDSTSTSSECTASEILPSVLPPSGVLTKKKAEAFLTSEERPLAASPSVMNENQAENLPEITKIVSNVREETGIDDDHEISLVTCDDDEDVFEDVGNSHNNLNPPLQTSKPLAAQYSSKISSLVTLTSNSCSSDRPSSSNDITSSNNIVTSLSNIGSSSSNNVTSSSSTMTSPSNHAGDEITVNTSTQVTPSLQPCVVSAATQLTDINISLVNPSLSIEALLGRSISNNQPGSKSSSNTNQQNATLNDSNVLKKVDLVIEDLHKSHLKICTSLLRQSTVHDSAVVRKVDAVIADLENDPRAPLSPCFAPISDWLCVDGSMFEVEKYELNERVNSLVADVKQLSEQLVPDIDKRLENLQKNLPQRESSDGKERIKLCSDSDHVFYPQKNVLMSADDKRERKRWNKLIDTFHKHVDGRLFELTSWTEKSAQFDFGSEVSAGIQVEVQFGDDLHGHMFCDEVSHRKITDIDLIWSSTQDEDSNDELYHFAYGKLLSDLLNDVEESLYPDTTYLQPLLSYVGDVIVKSRRLGGEIMFLSTKHLVNVNDHRLTVQFVSFLGNLMFDLVIDINVGTYGTESLQYEYIHHIGADVRNKVNSAISKLPCQPGLLSDVISACELVLDAQPKRELRSYSK